MIEVNYITVLISAVAAMVIGSVWYGPLFGKKWMGLIGISKSDVKKEDMPKMYGVMFIGVLIEAYVLSNFIQSGGATNIIDGAKVGAWAWLGFVGTVMLGNYMFSKKPINLYLIDAGYALVNLLVMGAIIGVMG